jgi:hypothetical protein
MNLGLILGGLTGGASAVSSLADQAIKEAEEAKKQAYEKGLLEWKVSETRKDADTQFGRQKEMSAISTEEQLRINKQNNDAADVRADKANAAHIQVAKISANRSSSSEKAMSDLLQLKREYLHEEDPEKRKKLAEDITFYEGRTAPKNEYMTVKDELGGEKVYQKTANGLVPAQISGGLISGQMGSKNPAPWERSLKAAQEPTPKANQVANPMQPNATSQTQRELNPQNTDDLNVMYNRGIQDGLVNIQNQLRAATTDEQKTKLAQQYTEMQARLKR